MPHISQIPKDTICPGCKYPIAGIHFESCPYLKKNAPIKMSDGLNDTKPLTTCPICAFQGRPYCNCLQIAPIPPEHPWSSKVSPTMKIEFPCQSGQCMYCGHTLPSHYSFCSLALPMPTPNKPTMNNPEKQQTIQNALDGKRGEDQQRIAQVGLDFVDTLLRKNNDYGSSIWKKPLLAPNTDVAAAILVRMTDKVERLISLQQKKSEVTDESFDDTMKDLGAYALLYLARPKS